MIDEFLNTQYGIESVILIKKQTFVKIMMKRTIH